MVFQSGRLAVRLPQLNFSLLGSRWKGPTFSSTERVQILHDVLRSQQHTDLTLKTSLITPIVRRNYAQKAVSRPKAHTGRTTAATRKAPTTSKTKAAKKPAAKKTAPKPVPKAKSTAKLRAKPKPKPRTKATKKPKQGLTDSQKKALTIKELKKTALSIPHMTPANTWQVFLAEFVKSGSNATTAAKEASVQYKQLSPERLEHYNHVANQNKAANEAAYRSWIESHTPLIIYQANLARKRLKRLGKSPVGSNARLQDHRQVKAPISSYAFFNMSRYRSGDYRGLKVSESSKLASREFKALSASEKKPFEDQAAHERMRYIQERKTVLDKDVPPGKNTSEAA